MNYEEQLKTFLLSLKIKFNTKTLTQCLEYVLVYKLHNFIEIVKKNQFKKMKQILNYFAAIDNSKNEITTLLLRIESILRTFVPKSVTSVDYFTNVITRLYKKYPNQFDWNNLKKYAEWRNYYCHSNVFEGLFDLKEAAVKIKELIIFKNQIINLSQNFTVLKQVVNENVTKKELFGSYKHLIDQYQFNFFKPLLLKLINEYINHHFDSNYLDWLRNQLKLSLTNFNWNHFLSNLDIFKKHQAEIDEMTINFKTNIIHNEQEQLLYQTLKKTFNFRDSGLKEYDLSNLLNVMNNISIHAFKRKLQEFKKHQLISKDLNESWEFLINYDYSNNNYAQLNLN